MTKETNEAVQETLVAVNEGVQSFLESIMGIEKKEDDEPKCECKCDRDRK